MIIVEKPKIERWKSGVLDRITIYGGDICVDFIVNHYAHDWMLELPDKVVILRADEIDDNEDLFDEALRATRVVIWSIGNSGGC